MPEQATRCHLLNASFLSSLQVPCGGRGALIIWKSGKDAAMKGHVWQRGTRRLWRAMLSLEDLGFGDDEPD